MSKMIYLDVKSGQWRTIDKVCACGECSHVDNFPECAIEFTCLCNKPATEDEIKDHLKHIYKMLNDAIERGFVEKITGAK